LCLDSASLLGPHSLPLRHNRLICPASKRRYKSASMGPIKLLLAHITERISPLFKRSHRRNSRLYARAVIYGRRRCTLPLLLVRARGHNSYGQECDSPPISGIPLLASSNRGAATGRSGARNCVAPRPLSIFAPFVVLLPVPPWPRLRQSISFPAFASRCCGTHTQAHVGRGA
jgi:hypothetical protein